MAESDTKHCDDGRHAVVAVIVEQSRFLVIRRSEFVRAPGLICFPGGGIENGEDFEEAIRREMREELLLEVDVMEHLWTSVTRWGTKLEWLLCRRQRNSDPIPTPAEVAEVMWLSHSELKERADLLGSLPDFFEALRKREFTL